MVKPMTIATINSFHQVYSIIKLLKNSTSLLKHVLKLDKLIYPLTFIPMDSKLFFIQMIISGILPLKNINLKELRNQYHWTLNLQTLHTDTCTFALKSIWEND